MILFRRQPRASTELDQLHAVAFYEGDDALVSRIEAFAVEGARRGETTVVIATPTHRRMLRERLVARALEGSLLELDAQDTLNRCMVDGQPDAGLFEGTVAPLVKGRVRAYGEMVSLLLGQDNLAGTLALEELWNGLQARSAFPLLCAYDIAQFDDHDGLAALCDTHTRVFPLAA